MFRDCELCPDMIILPAGTFQMGPLPNDPEHRWHGPQRTVSIGRFAVGRFEVTNEEWRPCISVSGCPPAFRPGTMVSRGNGSALPEEEVYGAPRQPVVGVSWDEAQVYAAWLSRRTGKVYRLLSEAEWEYAARAGTTGPFYSGESVTSAQANIEYGGVTSPVGAYPANPFGLFDTIGNAYEWTQDCYSEGYAGAPADGSAFERPNCEHRVYRGARSNMLFMDRHYVRWHFPSDSGGMDSGFRIARALE
jgi:formylglycine-generating enzyme required for sulfatase activity